MSNLTSGTRPQPYGSGGRKVFLPVKALAQIYEGAMVAQISGACCTGTTASSGHCIGVAESDALGGATDGATRIAIWTDKVFIFNAGTFTPTDATPFGTVLWMETDNTVGTGAGNETQIAGRFVGMEDDGRVRVYISTSASWFDTNANPNDGGSSLFKARAVITSLDVNTGTTTGTLTKSTNGALATQDGVTLAVGDVVLIPAGTTNLAAASDAGPYVVSALGQTSVSKWKLTRPSWWQTGVTIQSGQRIDVGEGTLFGNTEWKATCVKGKVVDTDDPLFYPKAVIQQVTLSNGTATITNVPMLSATKSSVIPVYAGAGTPNAATLTYVPGVITPGAIGTASVVVSSVKAAMVAQGTDTSVLNVTIMNW